MLSRTDRRRVATDLTQTVSTALICGWTAVMAGSALVVSLQSGGAAGPWIAFLAAAAAFSARQAWRAAANSSRHLFELAVLGDPALALQVQRCEPHDARALQRRLYLAGAAEWRRIRRNA